MGRQWLHAKRQVASLKKTQATGKVVREIMVAAKMGGADPALNARLGAALEKARKENVSRDVIERTIKKATGTGDEKLVMDQIIYEGYAPHKVPVIVEVYTDNPNRTAPEMRVLFRRGTMGSAGSNRFLFDLVGLVEGYLQPEGEIDLEEIAIECGAEEVYLLSHEENNDIPVDSLGARFVTGRTDVHGVSMALGAKGWKIVTSELGYLPKNYPELTEQERIDVGEFLQELEDHDDVHRVWAAVK